MAAVSISVGGISIELGDEDESAKRLIRLAEKTIANLVDFLDEKGEDPEGGNVHERCGKDVHPTNMESHMRTCHG